jgi:hypothetical protein
MNKIVALPHRADRLIENEDAWRSQPDAKKAMLLDQSAKAQIHRALALYKHGTITDEEAYNQIVNLAKIALQVQAHHQP